MEFLKGSDGLIERVLYQLGLRPRLKVIYEVEVISEKAGRYVRTPTPEVMLRDLENFPNWGIKENLVVDLVSEEVPEAYTGRRGEEDTIGTIQVEHLW